MTEVRYPIEGMKFVGFGSKIIGSKIIGSKIITSNN
jgi:hypothetical protein